jgi:hypothetical protein
MKLKVVVAIVLVAAVPMYAHAQNPRVSEGDAEKVATIISGDKIKTRAYCDIHKLAKQVTEANESSFIPRPDAVPKSGRELITDLSF